MTSPTFAFATPPQLVRAPDKTITFTGAANFGQAGTNVTVYTITGRVLIVYFPPPFCTTGLGEAGATATVSLGTASQVGAIISATDSVNIDTNEWWEPDTLGQGYGLALTAKFPAGVSESIIINCLVQNTNAGVLAFQGVHYIPLTAGAALS